MKIGGPQDKLLMVNVMSKAFEENLSKDYIVKKDKKKSERIKFLMESGFEICLMKGRIILSDDYNACLCFDFILGR